MTYNIQVRRYKIGTGKHAELYYEFECETVVRESAIIDWMNDTDFEIEFIRNFDTNWGSSRDCSVTMEFGDEGEYRLFALRHGLS